MYSDDAQPIFDQIAIAVKDEIAAIDAFIEASISRDPVTYHDAETALKIARKRISDLSVELERFRLRD